MNILRPLSPHLPIYKPQLTSTFPISHRISGAFLVTIVLFFYLLCLKIGLICFTYDNFYQFFFYSSKFILIPVEITALALSYHLFCGLLKLLLPFFFKIKSTCLPLFAMWTHLREIPFRRNFFSWISLILSRILPGIELLFYFFKKEAPFLKKVKKTKWGRAFINMIEPSPLVNIFPRDIVKTREELQRESPDFLYHKCLLITKIAICDELSDLLEKNGMIFQEGFPLDERLLEDFFKNLGTPHPDCQFLFLVYQDIVAWQTKSQFYKKFIIFINENDKFHALINFRGGKLGAG